MATVAGVTELAVESAAVERAKRHGVLRRIHWVKAIDKLWTFFSAVGAKVERASSLPAVPSSGDRSRQTTHQVWYVANSKYLGR